MNSQKVIKYQYAIDAQEEIVYIENLERSPDLKKQIFTCISCSNELIPKLGQIRKKHFAHKHIYNCSPETYLHRLIKTLFVQEYQKCLARKEPFYIELEIKRICNAYQNALGITCTIKSINKHFDLTKRYTKIALETREDDFIPDILLSDELGQKKLFIEIAVTHLLTEKKSNSRFNIIEIRVDKEEDADFITQRLISQSDPKVRLVHFDIKPEIGNWCDNRNCTQEIGLFIVFMNGKSILKLESLPKANAKIAANKNLWLYYEIVEIMGTYSLAIGEQYKERIVNAYNKGIKIKNCFLCRYHGENWSYSGEDNPIFCKFLKIRCNSNYAAECQYYKPDPNCFPATNYLDE